MGLQCLDCPAGASVTADGLGCACAANTYWVSGDGTSPYGTCTSCTASSQVLSWDESVCVSCDGTSATFDATAADCVCGDPTTEVVVEFDQVGVRLASKACVACPSGSFPHPTEKGTCFSCPTVGPPGGTVAMTYDSSSQTCLCPTGASAVADCFDATINSAALATKFATTLDAAARTLNFYDMGADLNSATVESSHFAANLVEAAAECRNYANRTRCNHLANMCVLTMYDTNSAACKLYEGIVDERRAIEYHSGSGEMNDQSPVGWSETTPWLFYSTATAYARRQDVGITVTFDEPKTGTAAAESTETSELVFVLSVSTLSGEWLGFKKMGKLMQLCGGRESDLAAWQRFGTNYYNDCSLPVADALDAARGFGVSTAGETLFFDLYIQDLGSKAASAGEWPERLYPVPIKVTNVAVNLNDASDDDLYVRRFFVVDETAGVRVSDGATVAVTYAQTIKIDVEMRSDDLTKIYPPVMTVTYASRDPAFEYVVEDVVSFRAVYAADNGSFWESWRIIFITVMVLTGAAWLYGVLQTSRRRQTRDPDAKTMMHAAGSGANAIASGLTIVMFWASGYFFLFYKAQTDVYTMVPLDSSSEVKLFKELLDAAVSFAAIGVAYLIQWQTNYDIFFLDWERPRTSSAPNGKMDASPVSAWRKMFIANEWNELQSQRVTSRELTLLLMVLFLEGLNGRNLAIIEPSMGTDDPAPYQVSSALLRFAVAAGLMVVIVACQMAYKIVFHHNYVEHPVQQFVDLLGMANLSIVILDDECAGYYLHGRSLMTFADTSMAELMAQMRKEQEMQVSARGLVPAAHREDLAENQCFELFITKELRMAYESKLLRRIEENDAMRGAGGLGGAVGTVMGGGRAGRGGRGGGGFMTGGRDGGFRGGGGGGWEGQRGGGLPTSGGVPDHTLAAAEEIGDIFKQLINFTEANAASFVLERPFTDRLMNMPPESVSMMQGASPIFYHDMQMSFQRILFYGIEWHLMIFDLLVFTAIDKDLGSFAVSAFLTWLVGMFVDHLRQSFGEANISRKSLIDSRFLI